MEPTTKTPLLNGLIICGPGGSGKSYTADCIAQMLCTDEAQIGRTVARDLLQSDKPLTTEQSAQLSLNADFKVLIIDEVVERWQLQDLIHKTLLGFRLKGEEYHVRPYLIFCTQLHAQACEYFRSGALFGRYAEIINLAERKQS